jgi:thioredoxin reductase
VAGLFYGIGHQPNSKLISHRVEVDEKGYVKVR